jgi:hypothetical protein
LVATGFTALFFRPRQSTLHGALMHDQAKALGDALRKALGI